MPPTVKVEGGAGRHYAHIGQLGLNLNGQDGAHGGQRVTPPGLFESAWKHRFLLLLIVVLAATAAYVLSSRSSPTFEAQARLLLSDPRGNVASQNDFGGIEPARTLQNQVERVTSTPVLRSALEALDSEATVDSVAGRVSAEASPNSDVVVVRARDTTGEGAAALANSVATAYQDAVADDVSESAQSAAELLAEREDELRQRVRQLSRQADNGASGETSRTGVSAERQLVTQQIVELQSQMDSILVEASLFGSGVEVFEPASAPVVPVEPEPLRDAAFAAVVSLAAGAAILWMRALQDAAREESLEEALGNPSLGLVDILPSSDSAIRLAGRGSAAADGFQLIVSALDNASSLDGGKCILVTSALAGEGKTTVAVNLAVAAAMDGRRVAIVDAVYGDGSITDLLGIDGVPGLTELADDDVSFGSCVRQFRLSEGTAPMHVSRLTFVPRGRVVDEPAAFFRTAAFRRAVERVQETAELVVVDARSLLSSADAATIAGYVDGVVLVVGTSTSGSQLEHAQELLRRANARVLGHIVDRAAPGRSSSRENSRERRDRGR